MTSLKLKFGSKIAVIGGGPAGSFFAISALRLAKELSRKIEVIIFEQKKFGRKGPWGCNKCAGVIQNSLIHNLKDINIEIEDELVQNRIDGYTFWVKGMSASINQKPGSHILTVFRGGGPLRSEYSTQNSSFDDYILKKAVEMGASCVYKAVTDIKLSKNPDIPVKILYGKNDSMEADLVIGAFGVNAAKISGLPPGYTPPGAWHSFQAEIPLTASYIQKKFGDMIHVYFIKPKGVKYLAATPKHKYLSISAIGESVKIADLKRAITNSELNRFFPDDWRLECACHPRIPSSGAKGVVCDRFIAIGDAAYSRWLKNGIESAYFTALFAAEAALKRGISYNTLKRYYMNRCWRRFGVDNVFGKIIIHLHDLIMTNRILSYTYLSLVKKEQSSSGDHRRRLSEILWHLYTGDAPYFKILLKGCNPVLQIRLLIETVILLFRGKV